MPNDSAKSYWFHPAYCDWTLNEYLEVSVEKGKGQLSQPKWVFFFYISFGYTMKVINKEARYKITFQGKTMIETPSSAIWFGGWP